MKTPDNIEVSDLSFTARRAAAAWKLDGARFHVWFDIETRKIEADRLYKNPLLEIERGDPRHFNTRHLDASAPKNAAVIKQVFDVIKRDMLIEKAIAAEHTRQREEKAAQDEKARLIRIKEAGPELYAALQRIIAINGCTAGDKALIAEFKHIARTALAKVAAK